MAIIRGRSGSGSENEPATTMRSEPQNSSSVSLIASAMRIQGDCEAQNRLRIEGHITGTVRAANLVIAPGGRVDGDVLGPEGQRASADAFIIEGNVGGAVRAPRVEIRADGVVSGGVFADEAVVHGRVTGGVVASHRLILEETAVVEGDVRARRLALKEGGQVNGSIEMGERAARPAAATSSSTGESKAAAAGSNKGVGSAGEVKAASTG